MNFNRLYLRSVLRNSNGNFELHCDLTRTYTQTYAHLMVPLYTSTLSAEIFNLNKKYSQNMRAYPKPSRQQNRLFFG